VEGTRNHRVVVSRRGGPDVLEVVEEPLPEPGPDEIRVEVIASGVSHYDIMVRSRSFPMFPRLPFTPGEDVVGVVDAVGRDVTAPLIGETVAAWMFGNGGGYAEYVCVPAWQAVSVPAGLDAAAAVALIVNYLTAHWSLHECARVRSGELVLVHGAAGGVGSALVQLGQLAGLDLFGTARAANLDLVADLGATPVDYRRGDLVAQVRGLSDGGVDVVFDPISGARHLWQSAQMLRKGGRLVMLGMVAATKSGTKAIPISLATIGLLRLMPNGRRTLLLPPMDKTYRTDHDRYRNTLSELLDHAATGKLKPLIAARVPLPEAARAHELIERGGHHGKVVLTSDI